MEEDAQKEEQRLLRTMNNRVNAALHNKPKANFTFGNTTSANGSAAATTTAAPPPSRAGHGITSPNFSSPPIHSPPQQTTGVVYSPPSYSAPAINFSAPSNFSNPLPRQSSTGKVEVKPAPVVAKNTTVASSSDAGDSNNGPEIVRHSNYNPEDEMKALFADDYERKLKMEEERLTRSLGKRSYVVSAKEKEERQASSPAQNAPKAGLPRSPSDQLPGALPRSSSDQFAATAHAQAHVHAHAAPPVAHPERQERAPSPPVHHRQERPSSPPAPAPAVAQTHYQEEDDQLIAVSEPALIPVSAAPAEPQVAFGVTVDATPTAAATGGGHSASSIMNTIDDVLLLAQGIGEIDIPVTRDVEVDVHVGREAEVEVAGDLDEPTDELHNDDLVDSIISSTQHHYQHQDQHHDDHHQQHHDDHHHQQQEQHHHQQEQHHHQHHAEHQHQHQFSKAEPNAGVNLLADLIDVHEDPKPVHEIVKFKSLVDSVSKLLKAEKPFNGDEALVTLETVGKLILGIVPTIPNARLSADVKNAAVDLIRASIELKHAFESWEDCDALISKVIVKLGTLYVNVVAAV